MPRIMPQIKKEWCDQILVVDGGSTDGTLEYSHAQGYDVCVQNGGWWSEAYLEGHERAAGDILVDFSPDGNSKPELIPVLADKIREGYDMAVASRYTAGAKSEDDTLITRFGNFFFTSLINLLFGSKYTDTLVIFRAYRKSLLKEIGMDQKMSNSFPPQISIRCAKFKKKVIDVPGDEPRRVGGHPKMNILKNGFANLFCVLKEFIFYRRTFSSVNPSFISSVLPDAALDRYRKEGYCVVEGILSPSECQQYLAFAESIAHTRETKYASLMNPDRQFLEFRQLLCHPKVVRCLKTLQESKIVALQSMLYYRSPGSLGRDLHQDSFYSKAEYGAYIGTWLPLEDTDAENGGLVVYPGSHREPLLPIVEDEERKKTNPRDFPNERGIQCVVPPGYSKEYLFVKSGSVVFIHGNLVHGSEDNLSKNRFRRVFTAHYIKEGYSFLPGTHARRQVIPVESPETG